MKERAWRASIALAVTAVVVGACLWPRTALPAGEQGCGVTLRCDKIVHVALFLAFALAWLRARPAGVARPAWGLWVIAAGLGLAVLTEVAQGLGCIGRRTDVLDGLADLAGVLLGVQLTGSLARDHGRAARVEAPAGRIPAGE